MKNNLIPIFLGAVSVFLSTACKENYELEEPRTITVTASFPMMVPVPSSTRHRARLT